MIAFPMESVVQNKVNPTKGTTNKDSLRLIVEIVWLYGLWKGIVQI